MFSALQGLSTPSGIASVLFNLPVGRSVATQGLI